MKSFQTNWNQTEMVSTVGGILEKSCEKSGTNQDIWLIKKHDSNIKTKHDSKIIKMWKKVPHQNLKLFHSKASYIQFHLCWYCLLCNNPKMKELKRTWLQLYHKICCIIPLKKPSVLKSIQLNIRPLKRLSQQCETKKKQIYSKLST